MFGINEVRLVGLTELKRLMMELIESIAVLAAETVEDMLLWIPSARPLRTVPRY